MIRRSRITKLLTKESVSLRDVLTATGTKHLPQRLALGGVGGGTLGATLAPHGEEAKDTLRNKALGALLGAGAGMAGMTIPLPGKKAREIAAQVQDRSNLERVLRAITEPTEGYITGKAPGKLKLNQAGGR